MVHEKWVVQMSQKSRASTAGVGFVLCDNFSKPLWAREAF
jgi:hypothetical protein